MRRQCVINGGGRRVLWVGLTVGGTDVLGCWCRARRVCDYTLDDEDTGTLLSPHPSPHRSIGLLYAYSVPGCLCSYPCTHNSVSALRAPTLNPEPYNPEPETLNPRPHTRAHTQSVGAAGTDADACRVQPAPAPEARVVEAWAAQVRLRREGRLAWQRCLTRTKRRLVAASIAVVETRDRGWLCSGVRSQAPRGPKASSQGVSLRLKYRPQNLTCYY